LTVEVKNYVETMPDNDYLDQLLDSMRFFGRSGIEAAFECDKIEIRRKALSIG